MVVATDIFSFCFLDDQVARRWRTLMRVATRCDVLDPDPFAVSVAEALQSTSCCEKCLTVVHRKFSRRYSDSMTSTKALLKLASHAALMAETVRLENSFYEFFKASWPHFDPAELVDNWHLKDICEHMQAVADGHISRLLLNEPQRTGKTAIISICYVAWVRRSSAAPMKGPQVSFFYASTPRLALEHSIKCLRLIQSRWCRALGPPLQDDPRAPVTSNDKGGYRMASSVDAKATGCGADVLIADDPHLSEGGGVGAVREDTVKWWSGRCRRA